MKIELDYSDVKMLAKKAKEVLQNTPNRTRRMDLKIARYGINFKVDVIQDLDDENHYEIDDISFWGINSQNVYVKFDSTRSMYYGEIHLDKK